MIQYILPISVLHNGMKRRVFHIGMVVSVRHMGWWVLRENDYFQNTLSPPLPSFALLYFTLHMITSSNGNIFRVTGPLCGNWPVTGEFPSQRPVTRSFDLFFDLRLNKRLSKQSWGWWFETPSCSFWRHCNERNKTSLGISKKCFFRFRHEFNFDNFDHRVLFRARSTCHFKKLYATWRSFCLGLCVQSCIMINLTISPVQVK